jgi:hypothetical protein
MTVFISSGVNAPTRTGANATASTPAAASTAAACVGVSSIGRPCAFNSAVFQGVAGSVGMWPCRYTTFAPPASPVAGVVLFRL